MAALVFPGALATPAIMRMAMFRLTSQIAASQPTLNLDPLEAN
jgi:hypothetical protein